VLPGTMPEPELARRHADTDAAVIMKLGRTFPAVRRALEAAGRLADAVYVERASMDEERVLPVAAWPGRSAVDRIEIGMRALGTTTEWSGNFQIDSVGYYDRPRR
jgi:precorrin-2 methylase